MLYFYKVMIVIVALAGLDKAGAVPATLGKNAGLEDTVASLNDKVAAVDFKVAMMLEGMAKHVHADSVKEKEPWYQCGFWRGIYQCNTGVIQVG